MKKQILLGAESFEKIREGDFFYIDKTMFVKDLLENRGEVTLITRPRRFGKTLNLSMLKSFFDVGADSKALFEGLKIAEHRDICDKHLNQYPVISLTLKNVEEDTYGDSLARLKTLVSAACQHHLYLYESDSLNQRQKEMFYSLFMRKPTDVDLKSALFFLMECLHAYHKKRVIVLLDEYDSPLDYAVRNGYYPEMISFMRGFLGNAFKTNEHLEFGVLTGVQRIAKESLFSSFNNPLVCGVMDKAFATSFGFTEDEVKAACGTYEIGDKYGEIKSWYDGYRFGGQDMYNPWSIVGYLRAQELDNYWVNTGSVRVLQDVYYQGDDALRDDLAGLLTGAPITMSLEDGITYPIRYTGSDTFWSLLLNAGYIKPCNGAKGDSFEAELVNREVSNVFTRYAKKWFGEQQSSVSEAVLAFVDCLLKGDAEGAGRVLNEDLLNNPGSHDFIMENSYHMFIYGMLLALSDKYTVHSNREAGKGRPDCVIKPLDKSGNAVVIEFKHVKSIPPGGL
ncbi:MAG: ATP-binding protein, partial [Clostridiales bacterium]|nr:ATP-binding protein [Clostridiales bacterium]